jgi:hypothetical protein
LLKTRNGILVTLILGLFALTAGAADPLFFGTNDTGPPPATIPAIKPWRTVPLDPDYGGQWVVAADLNMDGEVEFVACENHNDGDVHYTSTAVAHHLNGTVLWRWVLATQGALVELDGQTGQEKRRIRIPDEATDCITFADLAGRGGPTDILVKDRYHNIYAYSYSGQLLWHVRDPGGYLTAHQPRPIDLDGDGTDEIAAGYAMLNGDGSVRWTFMSSKFDLKRGHLDCIRLLRRGNKVEDVRLVLTLCGANGIAMIDGNGKVIWERAGSHFESIDLGRVVTERPGPQILVDIDHQPFGKGPLLLMDENGALLGRINTDYARHHHLLDWTGDGLDEILNAHSGAIYSNKGRRIATLTAPPATNKGEQSLLVGDFTGDGVPDVALVTTTALYIFKNESGVKPRQRIGLGTEFNFTLY